MLLKIEQRQRLEMPRGSQSHPLCGALWTACLERPGVLWAISCPEAALVHRCGAELNPMCSGLYQEKDHVQQRHGFIDATYHLQPVELVDYLGAVV